jgi:hypothetical protein
MKLQRIQLRRTRGWRMPANTVKIDRSTRWGNPFKIGEVLLHPVTQRTVEVSTAEIAIRLFDIHLHTEAGAGILTAARRDLSGRNLACWCKEGNPCHGDVLLRVANSTVGVRKAA